MASPPPLHEPGVQLTSLPMYKSYRTRPVTCSTTWGASAPQVVQLGTPPWDLAQLDHMAHPGPHQSAHEHCEFLYTEMADMADKGQWLVLPYAAARTLPRFCLSPVGVVPQHNRRPRTIVDYSFSSVNQATVPLMAPKAMQFGRTLR